MADNYTHQWIAMKVKVQLNMKNLQEDAFIWGANGPDPLFCYHVYGKKGGNIRRFGNYMHNYKTGLFLKNLFLYADTEIKKSYFLGFLCHYGADMTIHPWVHFHTTSGEHYDILEGHGYLEAGLDSYLYQKETGKLCVDANLYAPKLTKQALQEIAILLEQTVTSTYEKSYGEAVYKKSIVDFRMTKRFLRGNVAIFSMIERCMKMKPGYIKSHIQPAVMPLEVKTKWQDHFAHINHKESVDQVLERAIEQCVKITTYGLALLDEKHKLVEFETQVGNFNYETGLPLED